MSSTRSVSFVEHVELEFSGNIFKEALALGDVDNDGGNELVLGNVDGELSIFKGDCTKPWKTCRNLGMITCVGVGDVFNKGRNFLVCVTAEGWCYIFDVNRHFSDNIGYLEPLYSQNLAANCKALVVADVDGDGNQELTVAHTDRTVSLYRWDATPRQVSGSDQKLPDTQSATTTSTNIKKQSSNKEESLEPTKKVSRESKSGLKDEAKPESVPDKNEERKGQAAKTHVLQGCFQLMRSWILSEQIGSLVTFNTPTYTHLLVSQPGGSYVILRPEDASENDGTSTSNQDKQKLSDDKEEAEEAMFGIVGVSSASGNPTVPTDITALSKGENTASHHNRQLSRYVAMCTVDGSIVLLDGKKTLWSLEVNGNLFAISKLDITCDGNDELVVCSSDGLTYIADLQQNIVKFKFAENVMSFGAGNFAVTPRNNIPCLVYVTFSNRVIIYHSISQTRMSSSNLTVVMALDKERCQGLVEGVSSCVSREGRSTDQEKQSLLVAWCLYGAPQ